jgi:thiol-disulfide isomerase/thioredoxin
VFLLWVSLWAAVNLTELKAGPPMNADNHGSRSAFALLVLGGLVSLFPAAVAAADSRPVNLPFKDRDGKKVKVSDHRSKIVVLNFWATWCVPCREEMPMLVEAEKKYAPRGVVFLAVSIDGRETRGKIPGFVEQYKISFPVWVGGSTMDLDDLKLGESLPATAFLDRDGRIVARVLGQISREELDERLEWLTGDRKAPPPNPLVRHVPVSSVSSSR